MLKHLNRCLFGIVFIVFGVVFELHYLVVGQAVYGDGRMYYSYARATAIKGSLDIKEELYHRWSPESNNAAIPHEILGEKFDYPHQTVGPILFWSPLIKIGQEIANTLNLLGANIRTHGYSDFYQQIVGLSTVLIFSVAVYILFNRLVKNYDTQLVAVAILFFCLTTNLFYYSSIDVLNTHVFSFVLSTLILIRLFDKKELGVLVGFLLGMLVANRTNDIIIFLPLLIYKVFSNFSMDQLVKLAGGFIAGVLPQIAVWLVQFRSPLPPVLGNTWWNLTPQVWVSNIWSIFTGFPQGLLFSSPIVIGSILTFKFNKTNLLLLIGILLQLLVISSWYAPFGGESYGVRFLISSYPILIFWLAEFLNKHKFSGFAVVVIGLVLTVVNFTNILIFMLNHTGHNQTGLDPETHFRLNRLLEILRFR